MTTIRPEVYRRLVLAKSLCQYGGAACSDVHDDLHFTRGLLLLHDAVEACLGAIADHLHAPLTNTLYLLNYYDLIEKADPAHRSVPFKTQMRNLNTMRINAKHHGIMPDSKTNRHLHATVRALLEELFTRYLEVEYDSVSMKSLIRSDSVRGYIDTAETSLIAGQFESTLVHLGYAMYHIAEASTVRGRRFVNKIIKADSDSLLFTDPHDFHYSIRLLQHGVDSYLYYRFRNLTPRIAVDQITGDVIYSWDKQYGHPGNWTEYNSKFCLTFAIDTALRFQRADDEGYRLVGYQELYLDIIEPLDDSATFWDLPSTSSSIRILDKPPERKPLMKLLREQRITGFAYDTERDFDEWTVIIETLPSPIAGEIRVGYVKKAEVKVTTIERANIDSKPEQD